MTDHIKSVSYYPAMEIEVRGSSVHLATYTESGSGNHWSRGSQDPEIVAGILAWLDSHGVETAHRQP